jgi:aldose 1-epimerase
MQIKERLFGVLSDGSEVRLYTVSNDDMSFTVTDFGCLVTSIIIPSKNNRKDDILLGFSTLDGYVQSRRGYFSALVGRYANRIKNARFSLNGKEYQLDRNEGNNYVHGGFYGYDIRLWKGEIIETNEGAGVRLTHTSKDGDQGFPGNLQIEVYYLLNRNNELIQLYRAVTDMGTPVNITNHAYYNLAGAGKGTILAHELSFHCDSYLETDTELIPTGRLLPVDETIYDFRKAKPIGKDMGKAPNNVYDLCYVINGHPGILRPAAAIYDPISGRSMTVRTNQAGLQFYSGKRLAGIEGKLGLPCEDFGGFVLETQRLIDAPNHPHFPNSILHAGEVYEHKTIYGFTWQQGMQV